jgi:predicted transcriptional regulator
MENKTIVISNKSKNLLRLLDHMGKRKKELQKKLDEKVDKINNAIEARNKNKNGTEQH